MSVTGQALGIYRMTQSADAITGQTHVTYVRWIGGTTAGHSCVLTDSNGVVFFEGECDGANFTDLQAVNRWVNGIIVDTLQSGVVMVYTK